MSSINKILLALEESRIPQGAVERIRAAGGGREVIVRSDKAGIEEVLDGVEIAAGNFPPSLLAKAPGLKWVHAWYAGVDWLQKLPETKDLPFTLTTSSGMHGPQMTEHLFGMLFAWNRKFPRAFAAQAKREWQGFKQTDMDILAGKTMLILGYGSIGERFARAAEAFGMKVIGVRRTAAREDGIGSTVRVIALPGLPDVLGTADVVVNILPLTEETRNFCDAGFFAQMKRGALFANMGRGATVDEEAMAQSLRTGLLAGALLDVATVEPLPTSSPLWDSPNLILTSHYSGFHPRYDELALEIFLDNLGRYRRGEELRNVVDKKSGY